MIKVPTLVRLRLAKAQPVAFIEKQIFPDSHFRRPIWFPRSDSGQESRILLVRQDPRLNNAKFQTASTRSAAMVSEYLCYFAKGQIPPRISCARGGPQSYRLTINESEIEAE